MDDLVLVETSLSDGDAASLILELNALLDELYSPDDNHFSLDPGEVIEGRGLFVVARVHDEPVGCGALRMIDARRGEIKRMYVRPAAQGRGAGTAILARLEQQARRLGADSLVLEMGPGQPSAAALYRRSGFTRIECWGEYLATPASICLGKQL